MAKQTFLMNAHKLGARYQVVDWLFSRKLDGVRGFWDGGVTRGILKSLVPWANTAKDARYKVAPRATGLWTKYGHVIHAPDWWLDLLPPFPLDGECFAGHGRWQYCASVVKQLIPDERWRDITYQVFAAPNLDIVLAPRVIDEINFRKHIPSGCIAWCKGIRDSVDLGCPRNADFEKQFAWLEERVGENKVVQLVAHTRVETMFQADDLFDEALAAGAEGGVFVNPRGMYVTQRSHNMLKLKPFLDDEGTITGFVTGDIGKGGKYRGMIGALVVEWKGKSFQLSGLTDDEREIASRIADFTNQDAAAWAYDHPDMPCPNWIAGKMFNRGDRITFRYRELSDTGIPKEARFLRPDIGA